MRTLAASLGVLPAAALAFTLQSGEVKPDGTIANAQVYNSLGCNGGNISPSLVWKDPPAETKSFAVTVFDPDAPTGQGWWHWVVFNIPPDTLSLPAGAGDPAAGKLPAGAVQVRTDYGESGYGGPCPPRGDKPHRYVFTVYALKTDKLNADASTAAARLGSLIEANQIGKATLTAKYGRK